jgi:hypothetical protein
MSGRTGRNEVMKTRGWMTAVVGLSLLSLAATATAQTGSCFDVDSCRVATDRPAAILIYPRVEVDPARGVDTVVHLVNTSEAPVGVRCSYVNANGHCTNSGEVCRTSLECGGGVCTAGWSETDFRITLTRLQPISWNVSQGLPFLPCDFLSGQGSCQQRNDGRIPPAPETPFLGELKCIEVDDSDAPLDLNDLVGEATVIRASGGLLDAAKYNAVGIQAIPGVNDHDNNLCLGGIAASATCPEGAEYAGCPQTVIADHLFDGASIGNSGPVSNRLTLVPCAQDLLNQSPASVTVQILVFNEYEQRTSTSFRVRCFADRLLSDIDTTPGDPSDDSSSIFNAGTQGTLAGQTRFTGVQSTSGANGIVGVLEAFRPCDDGPDGVCGAAVNLHQQGRRAATDVIRLP